jgi:endonuclease/exonuclease/phosphatase family metal-dependent hydrolase
MNKFFGLLLLCASVSSYAGITIGAYNVRNFDYDQRARIATDKNALATIMGSLKADVLSVEEIVNTKEFEIFVNTRMPGYDTELSRCGGAHNQHLGFVYNKNTVDLIGFSEDSATSGNGECDGGSRPMAIALFQIKATKQKFYGITVHLKSGSTADSIVKRQEQFRAITRTVKELQAKSGVKDFYIAGDMNTTEFLSRGEDYQYLNTLTKELNMVDTSANIGCSAYWWGGTDDKIETPSLLDHVIVTKGLLKLSAPISKAHAHCAQVSCREVPVAQLGLSYGKVSDHCPVTATIQ